jgi:hypothetical protein
MSVYADPVHEALSALGGKTNWYARAELLQGLHAHGAGFVTDVVLKSNLAKPPFKSLDEHYNPLGVYRKKFARVLVDGPGDPPRHVVSGRASEERRTWRRTLALLAGPS